MRAHSSSAFDPSNLVAVDYSSQILDEHQGFSEGGYSPVTSVHTAVEPLSAQEEGGGFNSSGKEGKKGSLWRRMEEGEHSLCDSEWKRANFVATSAPLHSEPLNDDVIVENHEPIETERVVNKEGTHIVERDPNFFTLSAYFRRCFGAGHRGPPWFTFSYDVLFTCLFTMISMTILATLEYYGLQPYNLGMLSYLPSFGASSTLVFYLYTSPGAQPRALILTHITGAFLGISWAHITKPLGEPLNQLLACAIAVSMMTALLMLTNSFQPSASATTCLAAFHLYGQLSDQGYIFLVTPATIGPVIIVFLGWIFNNLIPWRHCYPSWL